MRNNLLFAGINEPENERPQDVEAKVRSFIIDKLQLPQDLVNSMVIERAHRIGAKDSVQNQNRSRMIVCKFANFKDKEIIRKQGNLLKDTNFSIREQFPPEIVERRRKLFPQLKAARDAGKIAWLAYDTLYVDGKPVQKK
ncbi:uncharacterized protein LOC127878862 [Dreissena polymorpha]|uniref:uncharacterized protein LOC127878862 n=1 Tax=Dreissena polymorpha TaxID=45954 RepID=UPI0022642D7D|nr:uncharacterized protein LOC127878862 [Dreissena polymorpha]